MKNNIRKIALGLCLTGALTACDLDVVPPADIAAENFWQTEKDAWYAACGFGFSSVHLFK